MTKSQLIDELTNLQSRLDSTDMSWQASIREEQNQPCFDLTSEDIISLITDLFFVFDSKGRFLYVNKMAAEVLEYSSDELLQRSFFDIYPQSNKTALQKYLAAGQFAADDFFKIPLQSKTGRYIPAKTHLTKTTWCGRPAVFALIKDMTTQKRQEVEITMLSHALRNVSESLSVFDLQGNIIFVNDSFVDTYGYEKEELIGQSIERFHNHKERGISFKSIIKKTLQGEWQGELTAIRKNEDRFIISLKTSLVRDDDGLPIVIIGVARDITERRQLEEQLRQSQKMEAIGQLAGGIAHDFNNLLTVIEGYTDMLLSSAEHDDSRLAFVQQIKKASDRATALTRQLLAFSRRQILQPKVLDLNELVPDVSALLKRLIGEDIELKIELAEDIAPIKADRSQIEQVLMNLAVNSRDAMPDGGTLIIKTSLTYLDDNFIRHRPETRKGHYVLLTITDTGMGMEDDVKTRIFEPFFTTKGKAKGTGLGLATVYGIIKQSGGYIGVESAPEQGTSFNIYLPLVTEKLEQNSVEDKQKNVQKGSETILVVEDEFLVRELVCDTLRNNGFTVIEATNGREAIEIFNKNQSDIDLVLTDVIMPEMSGRKLIEILMEKYPDLKALYMSGYTDDAIIKHGVLEPGMSYIQKPFSPRALIEKLQEVLTGSQ